MRGKLNENRGLKKTRYYVVTSDNVVEVKKFSSVFASSNLLGLYMSSTYTNIINELKQNFSIENSPTRSDVQQYRNLLSTLNSYLAFCGKTSGSNVGTELGTNFDTYLRDYLDAILVAPRTRRDRSTQLKSIRRLYKSVSSGLRTPPGEQTNLSAEIRRQIAQAGVPPKTLAKQAGVDPTTLSRWLKGARPRADTVPALRRLEARLGLERDALVQLIDKPSANQILVSTVPSHRVRLAERQKHKLTLPESELGQTFLAEWGALFEYKTTAFPLLERQPRGHWRLIPQAVSATVSKLAQRGNMVCPAAAIIIGRLRSFFGVLTNLPQEEGGISWYDTPPISLAWCAHPQALNSYLQWLTNQSDGLRHNSHKVFARAVCSLLRPITGFLWQQPSVYRHRLPEAFRPNSDEAWQEMCAKSHKFLRDYMRSANGLSRDPKEPIADLLALPDPLKPIREAVACIEADAVAAPPSSISEARHKRNALLLALLLSNPLRVRTLSSLTWLPNGQGTLRGSPSQGWRIQLQPQHLKTGSGQRSRGYDVKIADWVKPMMDEYIEEFRNTLLAKKSSPYLFVGDRDGELWEGLSKTVLNLTRRYIPGSPGFSPHAMRHLVATAWLRKHPGDFLTVAELLNDNLTTVLANYAHLRRDDSFARYEAYVATLS